MQQDFNNKKKLNEETLTKSSQEHLFSMHNTSEWNKKTATGVMQVETSLYKKKKRL